MAADRMTKDDPPLSSGIFKPIGHVLLAYERPEDLDAAQRLLGDRAFAPADVLHYSSDEMRERVDQDLLNAGALASMGSELNLARRRPEVDPAAGLDPVSPSAAEAWVR